MTREQQYSKFILVSLIMLFVMSTSESFAQQVTKNDLIEVLPDCTAFQKRIDPFIHYLGYAKEGRILNGLAFLTTDVVFNECWGYRSLIATLVGVNTEGKIIGVKVLSEFENPRFTKGFLESGSQFMVQFENKDANDIFILNYDIDAISGATITSSAVTRSIKLGLQIVTKELLNQQIVKTGAAEHLFFQHLIWQIDFIFLWIILFLAFLSFFKKNDWLRYFTLGMSFAYLGVMMGGGFSLFDILRLLSLNNHPIFLNNLYWYSLLFITIGLSVFAGRFYCGWLCPFGAFSEVLNRIIPVKMKISTNTDRLLKLFKYVNLIIILIITFVIGNEMLSMNILNTIEPFGTFFRLDGDLIAWVFLIFVLIFSAVISRFYCRYFCPLGAFFAVISKISTILKLRIFNVCLPQENCKHCKICQAQINCQMNVISHDKALKQPTIDDEECFMCNTCSKYCFIASNNHSVYEVKSLGTSGT